MTVVPISFFYTGVLAFMAGIGLGVFTTSGTLTLLLCSVLFLMVVALRPQYFFLVLVACLCIGGGVWRVWLAQATLNTAASRFTPAEEITEIGKVVREPDVRASVQYLTVSLRKVLVLVQADRYLAVAYGDEVQVTGVVEIPESFVSDIGREFDYQAYLAARGIVYVVPAAEVTVVSLATPSVVGTLLGIKQAFLSSIERHIPEPAAGLGAGVLLGVKRALGNDLEQAFRATGLIHIVVLSGYNIMLVVAFVSALLRPLLPPTPRLIVGLLAIVGFAVVVGLSATVVRASVMAILLLLATYGQRRYLALRGLMLAGLLMLVYNPLLLPYDVGFQFSFMATVGLILFHEVIESRLSFVPSLVGMRGIIAATIATYITVLPLLLFHIGELSFVSIPVNAIVLPLVPLSMLLTFIAGVLAFIVPTLASVVALGATLVLNIIIAIAQWWAALPFAVTTVPVFPWWAMVGCYVVIVAGWWRWGLKGGQ